ncbi:RrF2 family transcriptional regulator [Leptothoe spongobia]|uniref:Rrf2 family transcriptional regulator n=1 Tax=Leptothoe spongobia TAU-MAC 1115 TaxID=1967444 RepID=A0A947DGX9_9CYAN|nr:Rrf2 family transcriptional regulator [Leptothoe spongobia]MBT9315741.1 Rrf2 family transcriptional regulator [Leptothoe spongobia TAU-MAC 1115]
MELSCKSEYALLALLELSLNYDKGEPVQIRQIASQQNIPDRYLEQLLATLRRAGFVKSQRGAKGGYLLAQAPWNVLLLDIVNCIEGLEKKDNAGDAVLTTERQVVRGLWQSVQAAAQEVLSAHTLQDLVEQRNAKHQVDLMYYI